MKINIVTGSLYPLPPVGIGAVEKVWYDCAKYFASQSHEVTMLACRGEGEPGSETVDGVRIIRATNFKSTKYRAMNIAYEFMYSLIMLSKLSKADVTVLNSVAMPIFAPLKHGRTGRIVYNLQRYPKNHLGLYRYVDRISIVSNAVCDAAVRQSPSIAGLTKVIPNPINTDIFCYKEKPKDDSDCILLVYSGRIHPEKGLEVLVDAAKEIYKDHDRVELKLIGTWDVDKSGGGERYMQKLKERAGDLPITFTGAIANPSDLAGEMRKGDIYIYPSQADTGEAFGVAPLEAMGLGLPVIVSGLDCFKDFVKDGINGLIYDHKANNPASGLSAQLKTLINNVDLRKKLSANAVETAVRFSVDNIAEQYLADFESLCRK